MIISIRVSSQLRTMRSSCEIQAQTLQLATRESRASTHSVCHEGRHCHHQHGHDEAAVIGTDG